MQKDEIEEDYHNLCAEIVAEIVADYNKKTGKEISFQSHGYESTIAVTGAVTIDTCPSGDDPNEVIYLTFYKPGYVNFTFFSSLPTESYCIADPRFFEKATERIEEMVEYLNAKKENGKVVLEALKVPEPEGQPEQESQPQPLS